MWYATSSVRMWTNSKLRCLTSVFYVLNGEITTIYRVVSVMSAVICWMSEEMFCILTLTRHIIYLQTRIAQTEHVRNRA